MTDPAVDARDIVYVHSNLRLVDKLEEISYSETTVPWFEQREFISDEDRTTQLSLRVAAYKIKVTEHLQTNDRPIIQTCALCTFTLQTFTIFFRINAFINVYYNYFYRLSRLW